MRMPRLYVLACINGSPSGPPDNGSELGHAYYAAISDAKSWPYDIGDDPSFFASQYTGSPITWGMSASTLRRGFEEACERAGIPFGLAVEVGVIWHDLRRTFA